MNKVAKRIVISAAALVIVFFAVSFAIDKALLGRTFERVEPADPRLLPLYDAYAGNHPRESSDFQLDGSTLRGYVYKAENPKGLVVFRHGIFSQHADYLSLICALVDKGWSVYAYDAIGCGESDGDNVKGMAQSAVDVAAAVNHVRQSGIAGDLPIALWGHSWGGYGVAAALGTTSNISACVTMSGFNAPVEVLLESTKRSMGPAAFTQQPTIWLNNKLVFGADADRSAEEGINSSGVPVLVIHGTEDAIVGYDGSAIIAHRSRITNPKVSYIVKDEPGRNGHNSYFYEPAARAYLAEKSAELASLAQDYPEGMPASALAEFFEGYDRVRGNQPDAALIDSIDEFLSRALS